MKEKIAIGLGTKSRPEMLREALQSLIGIELPSGIEVTLIVCENGNDRVSENILDEVGGKLSFKSIYVVEERAGIVFMRNRILKEAISQEASLMAFFDDDEIVDSSWLCNLYETKIRFNSDVVQGHVIQKFEITPDSELVTQFYPGSFDMATGDELNQAYTGNVLFDLSLIRKHNLLFNEKLNLIGGSDSLFFIGLRNKGAKIVFCKEAIIHETIPPMKTTLEWLMTRFYRNGYSMFFIDTIIHGKVKAYWKGIGYVFRSIKKCISNSSTGIPKNEEELLVKKRCLRAKGVCDAMRGISFEEYKVTHGS